MIGAIVPVHNEEALLGCCLAALTVAARHAALAGETVRIVVVLDTCTDRSEAIACAAGVEILTVAARNVGVARAAGAALLIAGGARWLAFTDADSRVSPDWLAVQLSLGVDAVCGSICVDDWDAHPPAVREVFASVYRDRDGHRHVHGANLGVCAFAYRRAGGFPPLTCREDVALVERLIEIGANIAWSAAPRVVTSARVLARVRGGFGDTLAGWATQTL
ncbi:glycosyltransferase [Burkholderia sp. R-69980]|nr:glycosyltransferase [Burkholderia sp. R-69980]